MYRYFFSLLFIALAFAGIAQKLPERQKFVRVGVDLSRFTLPLIGDIGSKGFEVSMDAEVKARYFPTVEMGYQQINHEVPNLHYEMDGKYGRIGFDYNIIRYKHRLDRNLFYIGARLCYANGWHQASRIILSNPWGDISTSMSKTNFNATWFEGIMGLKAEIIKNFYLGVSVRIKSMIQHSDYGQYKPYIVPGFGKGFNVINTGVNYSIYYAIPIKNPKLDFEKN